MKNKEVTVGLLGNPNSGKTTLFNALTGARQKVANWSGVTVEKREGIMEIDGFTIHVIDLPGTYSLTSYTIEEIITRDFIINDKPDLLINVVDAGNLERNLYLSTQLIEMGTRTILSLNMYDEAEAKGLNIDTENLSVLLGMPVIKTIATHSQGIDDIKQAIIAIAEEKSEKIRHLHIQYGRDIETEIENIQSVIWKDTRIREIYSTRWLSIRLMEADADVEKRLHKYPNFDEIINQADASRQILENIFDDDIETIFTEKRYGFIVGALKEVISKTRPRRIDISERVDRIITNRYLGLPILFAFMWALFQLTFTLGEYPMKLIESGVKSLGSFFDTQLAPGPLKEMIIDGVIGGVGSVIVFLPNIVILFMGISFMEDTGYMARAAFKMDKVMHKLGLHGKSFIPLVMGFGCNVPAILATRTLENRQDRILSILINPFMSCSARLPVYVLFTGVFFREHAGNVILSLYLIGIFLAFVSARLFKLLFFRGPSTPFVMELPPYRMPTIKTTMLHMWDRASQYVKKMGGIILAFSIIIWALSTYPKSPEIEQNYAGKMKILESKYTEKISQAGKITTNRSVVKTLTHEYKLKKHVLEKEGQNVIKRNTFIGKFGDLINPLIRPLGFSWQMGIALSTGFVAKEIVISTMGVLYHASENEKEQENTLEAALHKPENGITPLIAYVFMLFVLLYVPCIATMVAIGREAGLRWAVFAIFYQLAIAWSICFIVYNLGLFFGPG